MPPETSITQLDHVEFAAKPSGVQVDEKTGDVRFRATLIDKQKEPNRRGFKFAWETKEDVIIENWAQNPVLLFMHEHYAIPVGMAERIAVMTTKVEADFVIPNLTEDPDMDEFDRLVLGPIRGAVRNQLMRAVSIGFYILRSVEEEGEDRPVIVVKGFEIVETSLVSIGAHPTALIKHAKPDLTFANEMVAGWFGRGHMVPEGEEGEERIWRLSLGDEPEGQAAYTCECVKCGHVVETDKHCRDLRCPKCGGEMRRKERPGPGQDAEVPEEQPFANEHACDINSGDYSRYARKNGERKHDGKPIDVVYGIRKSDGKSEVSSLRYKITDGWTESAAKSHCKGEDGTFAAATKQGAEEPTEQATWRAIPYSRHGDSAKAPEGAAWDAGKEVKAADVDALKKMGLLEDSESLDTKGAYKLPHHTAAGNKVVWRGVAAAMGVLLGARGGVKGVSAAAKKGAYNHNAKHYEQFDKAAPAFKQDYTADELQELHEQGLIIIPGADEREGQNPPTGGSDVDPSSLEQKIDKLIGTIERYLKAEAERGSKAAPGSASAHTREPARPGGVLDEVALRTIADRIADSPAFAALRERQANQLVEAMRRAKGLNVREIIKTLGGK